MFVLIMLFTSKERFDSGDVDIASNDVVSSSPSLGLRGGAEKKKKQKKVPRKKSEKLENFQAEGEFVRLRFSVV